MPVALVYSQHYDFELAGWERTHPFDLHKYARIHRQLVADGLARPSDFHEPHELSREEILLAHRPRYLETLQNPLAVAEYLEAPLLGFLPAEVVQQGLLRAFRYASAGTILAARLALEHGMGVNLGGGYHHAKPTRGEGFCVYNDLAIAIHVLRQAQLVRRVLVVDLDVHQGNGTIVCWRHSPDVFTFDMHEADVYPIPKEEGDLDIPLSAGTGDAEYLGLLERHLPGVLDGFRPEVVLFQAGCDPLRNDPLAHLALSESGILRRDACVVDWCVQRRVPVAVVLGGGYSAEAWKVQYASIARMIAQYGLVHR